MPIQNISIKAKIQIKPEHLDSSINDAIQDFSIANYCQKMVDNHFIISINDIHRDDDYKITDFGVVLSATLDCQAYGVQVGDEVDIHVEHETNIGKYGFDPVVGKKIALFFIPGNHTRNTSSVSQKVRIIGIRRELTFTCVAEEI